MPYRTRIIEAVLKKYLKFFSVVGLTGPRQSGKTTLLQHLLPEYTYISFDNPQTRLAFYDDPEKFIRQNQNNVIFDEVQKVPEIFKHNMVQKLTSLLTKNSIKQ